MNVRNVGVARKRGVALFLGVGSPALAATAPPLGTTQSFAVLGARR